MFPSSGPLNLDVEAISGICGSISIACWVVVFSPQIIENFRRSSAEGLSIEFIIIWLFGDVFNILGAVLQRVLPTMIILAVYYTFADIVLMGQCFYYRGFTLRDPRPDIPADTENERPTERSALLANGHSNPPRRPVVGPDSRKRSQSSFHERLTGRDGTHLSPATPIHPKPKNADSTAVLKPRQPRTWTKAILFNGTAIALVILAGVAGYYLSPSAPEKKHKDTSPVEDQADTLQFSLWGQIFGYICAVLYLGSRVPQLLLNYRRKSTEGLNALFFLFACIGNLTYVLSIFAFSPICSGQRHGHWSPPDDCHPGEAKAIYGRYILVNLSWLLGSLGTLFLDLAVFAQFWIYQASVTEDEALSATEDEIPSGTEDGEGFDESDDEP